MLQKLLFTSLAILLFVSAPSYAQRDGQTTETEIDYNSISLFPRYYYTLSFISDPRKSETEFIMRLQSYGVASGCAEMKKGRVEKELRKRYKEAIKNGYQVSYSAKGVRVEILDTEVKVNKKKHPDRYGTHDCDIKQLISYADIKLNRDELLKRGTEKIQIESIKYGDFGEHDLDVSKDRFIMKVKGNSGEYWHKFWFFPSNSIALEAPSAKQGQDVTELIREFGTSHGLIPMESVLKGYEIPYTAKNYVFFTDPSGKFINRLNDDTPNALVGKIQTTRTVYGVDGPREETQAIDLLVSYAIHPQAE